MDISPNALCKIQPGYVFYIPPKKHPDVLLNDFLYNRGEFSVFADFAFERNLKWNAQDAERKRQLINA